MLHDGDTVIVGVSGGADSVCLLFLLCYLKYEKIYDIDIKVVHINHMIRDNAKSDARFVEELCKELEKRFSISLSYHLFEIDVHGYAKENGLSVEEAGRYLRYDAFNQVLGDKKGKIAVAHHANDRAETMLFNLFRGSGIKGLTGISPVNDKIIRPLLNEERSQIEAFLKSEGLNYVTDETNLTDDYTRNKIRHNIIEYVEENIIKGAVRNMTNAAKQLDKADEFITECIKISSLKCISIKEEGRIIINVNALKSEHEYIIDRIIYDSIVYVTQKKKDITSEHVKQVSVLLDACGSKQVSLPYDVMALKEYDRLSIIKSSSSIRENPMNQNDFTMQVITDFTVEDIPKDLYTKWFDYDKISTVATIRTRKEGDYLIINNKGQRKLLKDYFINEKVPSLERDGTLLLADGDHIMWIIGKRISEYYKVTENTRRVLEVHYVGAH